jgi:hypothetical protein
MYFFKKTFAFYLGIVAHAWNCSYSGSREGEGHTSKPAQAKNSWDPFSTNGWAQ